MLFLDMRPFIEEANLYFWSRCNKIVSPRKKYEQLSPCWLIAVHVADEFYLGSHRQRKVVSAVTSVKGLAGRSPGGADVLRDPDAHERLALLGRSDLEALGVHGMEAH